MELSLAEAASLMGVSARTLRARAARGDIPARKRAGAWRFDRRDLPLTEAQRAGLQARVDEIRASVEAALPSRLAAHHGDRRRSLADLDAFRAALGVHTAIRAAERTPGRTRALASLEAALDELAEATLVYTRSSKLAALDRSRAALGRAITALFVEAGVPPAEPQHAWLLVLEHEVAPAIAGLARWASKLPGPRSEP